ncbi:MAG: ABC transporter permease [Thermoleophilia bacterium]|nr:ABC transporter permease [Thermoleophilia bacterium]
MSGIAIPSSTKTSVRRTRKAFRSLDPLGMAAAFVVLIALVLAVIGPMLAPYAPDDINLSNAFVGPGGGHLLGFDSQGRDLWSRLLTGARTSMVGPLIVVLLSTTFGIIGALTLAWKEGRVDQVLSRFVDSMLAFPGLLLAILVVAVFGVGLAAPVLALSIAYTPFFIRILRGAALRERKLPYVEALTVQGSSALSINFRHILPNLLPLVAAQSTINFGYALVDLAALSYLGLGVQQPQSDWGAMVFTGQTGILQGYPAESLAAGACIVIVVCAFTILGQRIADRAGAGTL